MLRFALFAAVSTLLTMSIGPASAQWADTVQPYNSTAGSGDQGSQNGQTPGNYYGNSWTTYQQTPAPIYGLPTTSSTVIPGTHLSLGNLALMTEHHSPIGGSLPPTNLDSFVAQSGYNFMVYGDEGTEGPPPLGFFETIGASRQLPTTGHQSDAPSAWY